MLDLPADKPEIVTRGLTRARRHRRRADDRSRAGREGTRRRDRGVARRTRRRLAHPRPAGARPVLPVALRRAAADRQAGRDPHRPRRSGCGRSTTPSIAPIGWRSCSSATPIRLALDAALRGHVRCGARAERRAAARAQRRRSAARTDARQRRDRPGSVRIVGEHPAQAAGRATVARRRLSAVAAAAARRADHERAVRGPRAARRCEGAGARRGQSPAQSGRDRVLAERGRARRTARRRRRRARRRGEAAAAARRRRRRNWIARSDGCRRFYSRALAERDKTESASYAREYVSHFLEGEPSPGIAYQYEMARQFVPGDDDVAEVSGLHQAAAWATRAASCLRCHRRSPAFRCRPRPTCARRLPRPRRWRCRPGTTPPRTRALMEHIPGAGRGRRAARPRGSRRHDRALRQWRRGVAEADRLQERRGACSRCTRPAGLSLASPDGVRRSVARDHVRGPVGRRRPEGVRAAEDAGRAARVGVAVRVAADAGHQRICRACAARDGAAAAAPAVRRSGRRSRRAGAAETAARCGPRQPRAEPDGRCSARRWARSTPPGTTPRGR